LIFIIHARKVVMKTHALCRYLVSILLFLSIAAPQYIQSANLDHPIRFAVIGDRTGGHHPGVYSSIVEEIELLKPDFVINVGDMIEGYADDSAIIRSEWNDYLSIISKLSMPIYYTAGNHDIWSDMSEEYYSNEIGKPYYSVDIDGIHFTFIDNSIAEESSEVDDEQIDWLKDDLAANTGMAYTIVFMHKPFWYNSLADGKPDMLHDIFVEYGVDAVFTGHFHIYFVGEFDGITYTSLGSSGGGVPEDIVGPVYHFAWVTLDSNGMHIAPIEAESVKPWDVITVQQVKYINKIKYTAVRVTDPLTLDNSLKPISNEFAIRIANLDSKHAITDTVTWNIPSGWAVDPETTIVEIAPDDAVHLEYTLDAPDSLFPLPSFVVSYPFAEGQYYHCTNDVFLDRTAYCERVGDEVVVDGDLSEYAEFTPMSDFFSPSGGTSEIDPVDFYFAWDKDAIYVAARCYDEYVDSISAAVTGHDGAIFGEDCIGYFIQPDRTKIEAYQIYFSAVGTVFDQIISPNADGYPDGDRNWNGEYTVATSKSDGFWTVEVRIPLEQWRVKPETGDEWGINFRRKQPRFGSAADWIIPIEYDPSTYGKLIFR